MQNGMSFLENIPDVPLRMILNNLEGADARNCRLLNRQLRSRTDDLFSNWTVRIDQSNVPMTVRALKIKNLKITGFVPPEGISFAWPDLIQSLEWQPQPNLNLSAGHLDLLLRSMTNLKTLKLDIPQMTLENSSVQLPEELYDFPHLLDLSISVGALSEGQNPLSTTRTNYFGNVQYLLRHLQTLKLTSLSFCMWDRNTRSIKLTTDALFGFIRRNGKGLRHLNFTSADEIFLPVRRNINRLKGFCSSLQTIRINTSGEPYSWKEWESLMRNQSHLVSLEVNSPQYLPWFILRITKPTYHWPTLTNLSIQHFYVEDGSPLSRLDMVIFQAFPNLENFKLHARDRWSHLRPIIMNLNSLPRTLQRLDIHGMFLETEDLLGLCLHRSNLTELEVGNTGELIPKGLRAETLLKILTSKTTLKRLEFVVGAFCIHGMLNDPKQLLALAKAMGLVEMKDLGLVKKERGVKLTRDSVESNWSFIA